MDQREIDLWWAAREAEFRGSGPAQENALAQLVDYDYQCSRCGAPASEKDKSCSNCGSCFDCG